MKFLILSQVRKNLLDRKEILLDVGMDNELNFIFINDFLQDGVELGET